MLAGGAAIAAVRSPCYHDNLQPTTGNVCSHSSPSPSLPSLPPPLLSFSSSPSSPFPPPHHIHPSTHTHTHTHIHTLLPHTSTPSPSPPTHTHTHRAYFQLTSFYPQWRSSDASYTQWYGPAVVSSPPQTKQPLITGCLATVQTSPYPREVRCDNATWTVTTPSPSLVRMYHSTQPQWTAA